jgi:hypothetical protein
VFGSTVPASWRGRVVRATEQLLCAVFRKNRPVPGMLSAEVLWTGEVVAEGSTSEESDWVEVTWSPVPVGPDLKYGFPRMPISGDSFMTLCGALRLAVAFRAR